MGGGLNILAEVTVNSKKETLRTFVLNTSKNSTSSLNFNPGFLANEL
jgi:hypothetical protein